MHKVRPSKFVMLGLAFLAATAIAASAQTFVDPVTFNTLVTFDEINGGRPYWKLVQGVDGNFYGTTGWGGTNDLGTVFRVTPQGALTTLDSLEYSHLSVQATDGNFYGTTPSLGPGNSGAVFQLSPAGTLTTLYNFCTQPGCADGEGPYGGVIQGSDGNFYGATAGGGAYYFGTVFKITAAGHLTTLASFTSPDVSLTPLVEGNDRNFYGTTVNTSAKTSGTIFRLSRWGRLATLHTFSGPDGKSPYAALITGSDGNFYGTTYRGGANDPAVCGGTGCGTIFKISPQGVLTTLHSFCARRDCEDGRWPTGDLVEGTDGNFYGTNEAGGTSNYGTAFRITPEGKLTTLHSFSLSGGAVPYAGLVQGTDGAFYGTTTLGGDPSCSCGTFFSLSVGLAPFVETRSTTGGVGTVITILGNNLLSSSSVTFNGTSATFQALSDTEIQATVPQGATTGTVTVTTSDGTLTSKSKFLVSR